MTVKPIALLDASNNATQYVSSADWQNQILAGWVDGTGGGYLWHRDPITLAWADTAAAQAWRTQQTADAAALTPHATARAHAAAVAANVVNRVLAADHTMDELILRLFVSSIQRVAPASRTALESAFLTQIAAADAETP